VESQRADLTAAERGAERFPTGSRLVLVSPGGRREVAPGFFAAADPAVSFDALRVLFAGRENPKSAWRIYEVPLESGTPKALSGGDADCIRPVYLPDSIVYARRTPTGFQVERLRDGSVDRLTHAPGNWLPSDILADSRILLDGPHALGRDIYTLYSDGSGIETVRCDHPGPPRRDPHQTDNGDVIFNSGMFVSASATAIPGANRPSGVLVAPRTIPNRHPSGLHDKDGSNLLCLSVYTSKLAIPDGSVSRVRVISEKGELGYAPVEADGSFYVHVPHDTPLRFELLDPSGRVVAAQKSWTWQRRGEQRVCIGCHAGPERAPENAVPGILLRDTRPVNLAGGHT
jgi:hypothetical protein